MQFAKITICKLSHRFAFRVSEITAKFGIENQFWRCLAKPGRLLHGRCFAHQMVAVDAAPQRQFLYPKTEHVAI
jgi:hypothetical protein